jgi:hypothetical protein
MSAANITNAADNGQPLPAWKRETQVPHYFHEGASQWPQTLTRVVMGEHQEQWLEIEKSLDHNCEPHSWGVVWVAKKFYGQDAVRPKGPINEGLKTIHSHPELVPGASC